MAKQKAAEKFGLTKLDADNALLTKTAAGEVADPFVLMGERVALLKTFSDKVLVSQVDHDEWKKKTNKSAGGRLRKSLLKQVIEPATSMREIINEVRLIARQYRNQILSDLKDMRAVRAEELAKERKEAEKEAKKAEAAKPAEAPAAATAAAEEKKS